MEQDVFDLIAGVKSGRHEDFEQLKAKYNPLLNDMVNSFEESGAGTKSDLFEEAQRALLKAAISFDAQKKGITFGLYAKICIRNALISQKRAVAARQRKKLRMDKASAAPRARAIASFGGLEADEILERIESSLSDYEKTVLKEYFSGRSAKEAAEALGTDEKSVNNAVYRIRSKAKRLGDLTQEKNGM